MTSAEEWTGGLAASEEHLLSCAHAGEVLDLNLALGDPSGDGQGSVNFAAMHDWPTDREIRANVLAHLLVASQWPIHPKGVRVRGARINGAFDLEWAKLRCPLVLEDCLLEEELVLHEAKVSLLKLVHCSLAGLAADRLVVTKELDLSRSKVTGAVRLSGAVITDQFTGDELVACF